MSYQVLARKWRPKSFEALVGQEHVVRALSNALEQQRLRLCRVEVRGGQGLREGGFGFVEMAGVDLVAGGGGWGAFHGGLGQAPIAR